MLGSYTAQEKGDGDEETIYFFLALIFLGSAGTTELIGSDGNTLLTQSGQMEHQMQAPSTGAMEHQHGGTHEHMKHPMTMPSGSMLQPAEGASVKILSPKPAQVFKGDEVPIQFRLVKGKKGNHVHAYVDGELMGMFSSEKGTLTGIQPGHHTLEVRVVAGDHQTELDATDKVQFVVK